ncbi:MAG: hypothetical protein JNL85_06510 [Rubrivivax sp.]|nr:hypothetical protein [Rubrivivax sp.]
MSGPLGPSPTGQRFAAALRSLEREFANLLRDIVLAPTRASRAGVTM